MTRRGIKSIQITPLILGLICSVPPIVITSSMVLAQSSQSSQSNQQTEAQRLYEAGEQLQQQGTRESLLQAIEKYQQALLLFRAVGDLTEERLRQRNGKARTLNNLGVIYSNIGRLQLALDYYQQALVIKRVVGDRQLSHP